ncbi:hypothetical protein SUGI_0823810 [Cryptomeria japonica]|nr:hypothetical protein SUGI_0823810 [Cryptomeria japonica]
MGNQPNRAMGSDRGRSIKKMGNEPNRAMGREEFPFLFLDCLRTETERNLEGGLSGLGKTEGRKGNLGKEQFY